MNKMISLRFPVDLKEEMMEIAKKENRSFSAQIVYMLKKSVEELKKQEEK